MSINVTVSGNPISIKNGRMCISDPNYAKKEFDKRRLMRLEQVRQQSRGIAEDIRNKVRKEKQKQISEIEREGKEKLKNWQNRKLLELQNQYKEPLSDISTSAFKEAEQFANESDIWSERKKENVKIAKKRGAEAAQRLQTEKNERSYEKAKPIQQKRMAREMENNRAAAVSKKDNKCRDSCRIRTKKLRKQPPPSAADINISIPQAVPCDSDDEDEIDNGSSSSVCGEEMSDNESDDVIEVNDTNGSYDNENEEDSRRPLREIDDNETRSRSKSCPDYCSTSHQKYEPEMTTEEYAQYHVGDTRISDRIRRRKYMASQPDFCDVAANIQPVAVVPTHDKYHEFYYNRSRQKPVAPATSHFTSENESAAENVSNNKENVRDKVNIGMTDKGAQVNIPKSSSKIVEKRKIASKTQIRSQKGIPKSPSKLSSKVEMNPKDIPFREPVKLKETPSQPSVQLSGSVPYYDQANKYLGRMPEPPSAVEKISRDSIEVVPNSLSEAEELTRIKLRDQEAKLRGQRALEKERIHRDYKELMKKLPLLRKQERINEIKQTDKPEYHMDEDRLKERERKRQNVMENRFAQLFPEKKPAIVTLPSSNQQNTPAAGQSANANWDVDFAASKMFSPAEMEQIASAMSEESSKDRQRKLKELLKSLKDQKRQLIKEIRSLPEDDSLVKVLNEADSNRKQKRKRSSTETDSSSPESTSSDTRHRSKKSDKVKSKSRTKVLILQNTSTQTTPKAQQSNEDKDVQTSLVTTADKACSKLHIPCTCSSPKKQTTSVQCEAKDDEELCKIVIKIKDDDQEVKVVKPKDTIIQKDKELKVAKKIDKPRPEVVKKTSWRDEFTQSSTNSSTTYYSPPDFQEVGKKSVFSKPQQENFSYFTSSKIESHHKQTPEYSATYTQASSTTTSAKVTPSLSKAIRKLLTMSRGSIDNLTVSTSEVPTPTESVVEMETNNPAAKLNDIIKRFNTAVQDAAKELSMSPDFSRISRQGSSKSKIESSSSKFIEPDTPSSNQYADITDSCSKRIAKLAEMIQKLRREKAEILNSATSSSSFSTISDKEKSAFETAYLELPSRVEPMTSSKESSSGEDTTLKRDLLDIDFSLANRLRKYPGDQTDQPQKVEFDLPQTTPEDILIGLKNLLDSKESDETIERMLTDAIAKRESPKKDSGVTLKSPEKTQKSPKKSSPKQSPKKSLSEKMDSNLDLKSPKRQLFTEPLSSKKDMQQEREGESFIPMLMDIPKLPVFEVNPEDPILNVSSTGKKPPPCKGCRKLNGEILLIPHELSTIVEIDSQLSTKVPTPNVTPKISKTKPPIAPQSSPVSGKSSWVQDSSSNSTSGTSSSNDNSGSNKKCTMKTCKDLKQLTESSSSDDIENFEHMLHNMGMDWAVSTLHKTREALALTSSSSSLELSAGRQNRTKLENSTELSWKDLLKQKVKFSSSTLNNTDTVPSFDISDLSAIIDKTAQRTSTPVLQGQSVAFASDLSSVKNESSKSSSKST